ncbi:MAG: TonB-dependent receptor, partial [Muribaculaceae bacterium]|nr:TonB-dependent receptor [Muribaculaceae bacterium]
MPKKIMKRGSSRLHILLKAMLVCMIFPISLHARTLTGVVTSATDDEPLIGATVSVSGTKNATVTDVEGNFTISVEDGQTLKFSYVGFEPYELKIKGQNKVTVKMKESSQTLDDLVVIGYGTMKRSDITGSVVSVGEEDIKKTVITSVDQALQGRAAGVQVTQNSGSPGGGISVSIRGVNSLNGNEPLYIIDGVAIEGQTNGNSSALSSINPSDIVSLEVLKDASATAIYGSRASNGVVIITTRHGSIGKPKISFEAYYALQQLPKSLETMNLREYAYLYNERVDVLGWGEREEFADPSILGEGTNWQKEIFRTAPMQNYQLSVTGGTEATQYMFSGGYMKQDGIALGSDFQRFSARINIDTKIAKWLQVGVQSSLSHSKKNNTIDNGNVIETALRQLPEMPAKNPDGSWGAQEENQLATYYSNPLADALTKENYEKGLQALVNAYADVKFYKDLTLRIEYGGSYNYNNSYQFTPELDLGTWKSTSSGNRSASNSSYWSFKQYLTWRHAFNKNNVEAMIGHEAQESAWENLWGSRTGYLFNSVHELNVADMKTAKNGNSKNSSSIESYFGRVNYSYDDRYLLTATLRADGSSTFGPANRWGWFPSAAIAWRFQNESFLRDVDWMTNGKLRLGWGLVGNQNAGSYAYGATMNSVATGWGTGFYPANFSNDKLKWEQTKSWNIGLDLAFLNNRIEFILDLYHKTTDNLLMQAALPTYVSGVINSPWVNTGSLQNKGLEFTLNAIPISNNNFSWRSGITFSLNRNKVLKLYTESTGIPGNIGGLTYTYTTVGEPVAQFYGYNVIGMFKEESDFYRKDANGDFLLDAHGNRQYVAIPENKTVDQGTG